MRIAATSLAALVLTVSANMGCSSAPSEELGDSSSLGVDGSPLQVVRNDAGRLAKAYGVDKEGVLHVVTASRWHTYEPRKYDGQAIDLLIAHTNLDFYVGKERVYSQLFAAAPLEGYFILGAQIGERGKRGHRELYCSIDVSHAEATGQSMITRRIETEGKQTDFETRLFPIGAPEQAEGFCDVETAFPEAHRGVDYFASFLRAEMKTRAAPVVTRPAAVDFTLRPLDEKDKKKEATLFHDGPMTQADYDRLEKCLGWGAGLATFSGLTKDSLKKPKSTTIIVGIIAFSIGVDICLFTEWVKEQGEKAKKKQDEEDEKEKEKGNSGGDKKDGGGGRRGGYTPPHPSDVGYDPSSRNQGQDRGGDSNGMMGGDVPSLNGADSERRQNDAPRPANCSDRPDGDPPPNGVASAPTLRLMDVCE